MVTFGVARRLVCGGFRLVCGGFRWFPRGPLHAIRSAIHITFAHGPAKKRIGPGFGPTWSDPNPDLARLDPIQAGPHQFEAILTFVWVRFRFVFRPFELCKCKSKCKLQVQMQVQMQIQVEMQVQSASANASAKCKCKCKCH